MVCSKLYRTSNFRIDHLFSIAFHSPTMNKSWIWRVIRKALKSFRLRENMELV